MIDHILGRPSTKFRKYQVFTVVLLWSLILRKTPQHGPWPVNKISQYLSKRLSVYRTLIIFCVSLYASRNFARVVGLESPEPLANLYKRSYFRATWVTTALDAGFWTAMRIKPAWLKDICSLVFSVYYLFCAEQADVMVRNVRGAITLEHLRNSWNKPRTPYIAWVNAVMRPKMCKYQPRQIYIERPRISHYKEPIKAWLYFDGNVQELANHDKIVFDIPGGGFVAMDPRCHDDKLLGWAWKTGLPVVALDYRKAPEYPYPYALDECYDAYRSLMESGGRCVGLAGTRFPKVIVSGDSAGGNLATGMILRIIEEEPYSAAHFDRVGEPVRIPLPEAFMSIYPALDMSINNWMTDEQMALIKAPERRKTNRNIIQRKRNDYSSLDPTTPYASSDEDSPRPSRSRSTAHRPVRNGTSPVMTESPTAIKIDGATAFPVPIPPLASSSVRTRSLSTGPKPLQTRLAMSSMISYFNDRILSPEMLRAMIILYIGPHNRPDFATDYYLSPLLAPEHLLAEFPKTYFMTGERDPLVDDTVIFAGRLRQAQFQKFRTRQDLGIIPDTAEFNEADFVRVMLIPGISHGFMQFVSVFEEGREYINQCSRWMREVFAAADERELQQGQTPTTASPVDTRTNSPVGLRSNSGSGYFSNSHNHKRRADGAASNTSVFTTANTTTSSADRDSENEDTPLEFSSITLAAANKSHAQHSSSDHPPARVGTAARRKSSGSGIGSNQPSGRGILRRSRAPPPRGLTLSRKPSLTGLASSEDLMRRRMQGLTSKLMDGGNQVVPQTP